MTIHELALNLIEHADDTRDLVNIDLTRAAEIISWLDPDSGLPEDLTPEAFMDAWNDIIGESVRRLWYAVQTDREDDWGIGSYDLEEAKAMARKQRELYPDTLIAVIDNTTNPDDPFCLEEITDF